MSTYDPTQTKKATLGEVSIEELVEIDRTCQECEQQTDLQLENPTAPLPLPNPLPTPIPIPSIPLPTPKIPIPTPIPGPLLIKNKVSGRYKYVSTSWNLELRIDIDGIQPMKMVSGDFFSITGATTSYFGSFKSDPALITLTATTIIIEAIGKFTWAAAYPKIRVTIPRTNIFQPLAAATLQFFTTLGTAGTSYCCAFNKRNFSTVILEQDREPNVTMFSSYNTGALPSGGSARILTVPDAYNEAGVDMPLSPATDLVPTTEAGTNSKWSNSELHAAMVKHCSIWKELPQWAVWLFHAYQHESGPGLYGIMFDQIGKQRQGCAVFYIGIGGTTADKLRLQLYTCVHELGHCFNLLHSWQKSLANPPQPNNPNAKSWMNYPWYYPGGAAAFWSAFPFKFEDPELIHIRHGFRNDVVMGGNNFTVGSALGAIQDPNAFDEPITDNSGLKLELQENNTNFALGEPVVVELKLSTTDTRGKIVNKLLHPNMGFVQIAIRRPSGQTQTYKPLMENCALPDIVELNAENPAVWESAYIGYGKDGLYFDQPGIYNIKAQYYALDGSAIVSNTLKLIVSVPLNKADQEMANLMMDDEQGTLLYLIGSDSDTLKAGNEAFETAIKKYPEHPLTVYAKFVIGYNKGRAFKTVTEDNRIILRKAKPDEAEKLLKPVIDASASGKGLDNISLNMTMRHLASAQKAAKDNTSAQATMKQMVDIFKAKKLNATIMETIEKQAKQVLE